MVCQAEGTVTPDGRHCPHLLIWLQLKHSLWFLRRNWWNLHVPFPRQRLGTGLLWLFFWQTRSHHWTKLETERPSACPVATWRRWRGSRPCPAPGPADRKGTEAPGGVDDAEGVHPL